MMFGYCGYPFLAVQQCRQSNLSRITYRAQDPWHYTLMVSTDDCTRPNCQFLAIRTKCLNAKKFALSLKVFLEATLKAV